MHIEFVFAPQLVFSWKFAFVAAIEHVMATIFQPELKLILESGSKCSYFYGGSVSEKMNLPRNNIKWPVLSIKTFISE